MDYRIIECLSLGARRHSEKTPSFREGMKAKSRTVVNFSFSNHSF